MVRQQWSRGLDVATQNVHQVFGHLRPPCPLSKLTNPSLLPSGSYFFRKALRNELSRERRVITVSEGHTWERWPLNKICPDLMRALTIKSRALTALERKSEPVYQQRALLKYPQQFIPLRCSLIIGKGILKESAAAASSVLSCSSVQSCQASEE